MHSLWSERTVPGEYRQGLKMEFRGAANESPDSPFARIAGCHAIIAGGQLHYGAEVMDRAGPTLRVIARTGIGVENVDLSAATPRSVLVCNAPDGPTLSTAEHTIALMLAVAKCLRANHLALNRGHCGNFFNENRGIDIAGLRLGLIGLGRIGSAVGRLATVLGMNVSAYDPLAQPMAWQNIRHVDRLHTLLSESDVISLHIPLTEQTRHLINSDALDRMKPGAILINCARGGVVDERALLKALDSGHLSGAGLDCFEKEPPPPDHPLLSRENVIATPHIAAATKEGKDRLWRSAISQIVDVLEGRRPPHLVNQEAWSDRAD